jgi:hypothetical protein
LDCFKEIYFEQLKYIIPFPYPYLEKYYDEFHSNLSEITHKEISDKQWNVICAYEELSKKLANSFKIRTIEEFNILDKCPLCRV